jgi:glycosyltransferase involved in cell wall biosynthesis
MLRTVSLTDWYRVSSAWLELKAAYELQRANYGIVHFLWADNDLGLMDILRFGGHFKLCGTFHGCGEDLKSVITNGRRLQRLDALILMSSGQVDFFLGCGVPAEKLHVILHGVDCQAWRPGSRRNHPRFRVLSVGGYRRNFSRLRELCQALAATPEIEVRVVAPKDCGRELELLDNVTILSGISDAELLDEYQQASCFVLAASNSTANNALLEALACGLPIVSEDVGGVSEYTSRDCALLTKPGDLNGMRAAIMHVFNSDAAQQEMPRAARARAEQLDWRIAANETLDLYRALANS